MNYTSRSVLLNRFIESLITVCNYSAGTVSDSLGHNAVMNVYLDEQSDLGEYCLKHPEYKAQGSLFAVSFSNQYKNASFLIDPKLFSQSHQILIDIALSMIGTVNYLLLAATRFSAPAHCALVEINGKGALICAPGGTGKSTCASRLPAPYRVLAEDCALVMQGESGFVAQAMPAWSLVTAEHKKVSGITFDCTASVKLAGLFFLEHGTVDKVEPLSHPLALGYINSSFNDHLRAFFHRIANNEMQQLRFKVFEFAQQFTAALPAYRLSATLDGCFWEKMMQVLKD